MSQSWLAALLGVGHASLSGTAVAIQLFDAWNDMNATMLVWVAFKFVDYPLWLLVNALTSPNTSTTAIFVSVAILGTIAWTLIGLILQTVWRIIVT